MKIIQKKIKIRDIVKDYIDESDTEGAIEGYSGNLNIRPAYQRNFVYNLEQSRKVIYTIMNNFPLNIIYWVDNGDGKYELLDGQQRIISICKFYCGEYSIFKDKTGKSSNITNIRYYNNLTEDEKQKFLDYELSVYICTDGTDIEKLDWFEIINTAGEKLNKQEIRNAIYHGPWVSDAKRYFSKKNGPAVNKGSNYMNGDANRQEYLETVIKWVSNKENTNIEEYMAKHQNDNNANELWVYYQEVIDWVQRIFPNYKKEMKGINWGELYNKFKGVTFNSAELSKKVDLLMADKEVTNNKGIYEYLLTGKESCLSLRTFDEDEKRTAYEQQKGLCKICNRPFDFEVMHGDHIKPWSAGGKTVQDNCQMLCRDCNLAKSNQVQN